MRSSSLGSRTARALREAVWLKWHLVPGLSPALAAPLAPGHRSEGQGNNSHKPKEPSLTAGLKNRFQYKPHLLQLYVLQPDN